MNKQMTPAEIELAQQSFVRLAFGVEYNEGGRGAPTMLAGDSTVAIYVAAILARRG